MSGSSRLLPTVSILTLVAAAILPAARGTGRAQTGGVRLAIRGQVVARKTGAPLAGAKIAVVKINPIGAEQPAAVADADGRFSVEGLDAGDYGLSVGISSAKVTDRWIDPQATAGPGAGLEEIPGLLDIALRRVTVSAKDSNNLRIEMVRMPTISGEVTDDAGSAIAAASVCALRQQARAGRREWSKSHCTQADHDGRYTLPVSAGTFMVSASVDVSFGREHARGPGPSYTLQRTFLPNATDISGAGTYVMEWDEERADMNIRLPRVATVRVSGTLVGAASAVARPYAHLAYADPLARRLDGFAAPAYFDSNMRFEFEGAPAGQYVIETYGGFLKDAASGQPVWTRYPVTVGEADVTGLQVTALPGVQLRGRVVFDGLPAPPVTQSFFKTPLVWVGPPDVFRSGHMMPPTAGIAADGTFASVVQEPGRYVVSVFVQPAGWRLRSAMVNGRDVADTPLDLQTDLGGAVLTLTNKPAGFSGRVATTTGSTAAQALVLAYPANRALWTDFGPGRRFRFAVTERDGTYMFNDLPAGEYLVAAVNDVPDSGWRDEVWLSSLAPLSTRTNVVEGAVSMLNLVVRMSPVR